MAIKTMVNKIAKMPITTRSSIKVKPRRRSLGIRYTLDLVKIICQGVFLPIITVRSYWAWEFCWVDKLGKRGRSSRLTKSPAAVAAAGERTTRVRLTDWEV